MTLFGNDNTCTLAYYMYWAFPFLSNGGSAAAAADLLPGRTLFVFFLALFRSAIGAAWKLFVPLLVLRWQEPNLTSCLR